MPKALSNLDLNKNEIKNVVIEKGATAPSDPVEGQIYYNTTDKNFYRYNGTSWVTYQNALDTVAVSEVSIDSTPTQSSTNLITSGGVYAAIQSGGSGLPDQTGHSGEFLTTDGTDASWETLPKEVFVATYNSTNYATVLSAYNAGKIIVCKYSTDIYYLTSYINSTTFCFSRTTNTNSIDYYTLTSSGWSNGSWIMVPQSRTINNKQLSSNITLTASDVSAISTSNLVTSVSSSSTNSQVPSAKLFYDTIGDVESILETLLSGSA